MSNPLNANEIIIHAAKKIQTPIFLYTWIDNYKSIVRDINSIKGIIYLSLLLLIIISSLTVISISLMTISERTQEIAILRSMGANNKLIQTIFFYYGIRSIIISSIIGLCTGTAIILNFEKIIFYLNKFYKYNILLDNIYYKHYFLLKFNMFDFIIIFFTTIVIGIITNLYPAYYASKIHPSKILKEH